MIAKVGSFFGMSTQTCLLLRYCSVFVWGNRVRWTTACSLYGFSKRIEPYVVTIGLISQQIASCLRCIPSNQPFLLPIYGCPYQSLAIV